MLLPLLCLKRYYQASFLLSTHISFFPISFFPALSLRSSRPHTKPLVYLSQKFMLEILLGIETIVGQLLCPTYKHYSPTAESTQWAKKQIGWDAVHSTIQPISSEEILHIRIQMWARQTWHLASWSSRAMYNSVWSVLFKSWGNCEDTNKRHIT